MPLNNIISFHNDSFDLVYLVLHILCHLFKLTLVYLSLLNEFLLLLYLINLLLFNLLLYLHLLLLLQLCNFFLPDHNIMFILYLLVIGLFVEVPFPVWWHSTPVELDCFHD